MGGGGGMCTYCASIGGSRVWRMGESERLLAALLEAVCTWRKISMSRGMVDPDRSNHNLIVSAFAYGVVTSRI